MDKEEFKQYVQNKITENRDIVMDIGERLMDNTNGNSNHRNTPDE